MGRIRAGESRDSWFNDDVASPFLVRSVPAPPRRLIRSSLDHAGMLKGLLSVVIALLGVLTWSAPARAYPSMLKHGYWGCGTCHADPSGGELLTRYGRIQGIELLAMRYGSGDASAGKPAASDMDSLDTPERPTRGGAASAAPKPSPPKSEEQEANPGFLWGLWDPPEPLLLGGAFRWMTLVHPTSVPLIQTFPMQADVWGQLTLGAVRGEVSLGVAKLRPGSTRARAAQVTSNPATDYNLLSRTHWIAVDFADGDLTLRLGRMNLPFGVRIPEHTMWVREATRTDRESSQEHGLALAFTGEAVRGEAMLIAGNYQIHPDRFRERGYSAYVEGRASEHIALGVSSLVTHAGEDRLGLAAGPMTRQAHGIFGRIAATPEFVVLSEFDGLLMSGRDAGYTGFVQLDYEFVQGLHGLVAGEVLDLGQTPGSPGNPLAREPGVGQPRFGGWLGVDWFFARQLELRIDGLVRQKDKLALFAQIHAYL